MQIVLLCDGKYTKSMENVAKATLWQSNESSHLNVFLSRCNRTVAFTEMVIYISLLSSQCMISLSLQSFRFSLQPNGNAYGDGHGLVTIRMKPDSQGRFGFNVKVRKV